MIRFRSSWRWLGAALALMVMVGCEGSLVEPDAGMMSVPAPSASVLFSTGTIVVTPGMMNGECPTPFDCYSTYPTGWLFYNDEADQGDPSLGTFVTGPGTPPSGSGSVQISVTGTQRRNLATYQFAGIALADITELKFSTYNPAAGNGGGATRSAYLNFNVSFDGNDTWQRRLVFVPRDQGGVQQDTWQEWDAIDGGDALWRYSGLTWPNTGTSGSTARTWDDLLASYPNIKVRDTDAHFGIRVGEPYSSGYTENIDKVVFGTAAGTTTWDFEPDDEQPVVLNVAAEPVAIGATGAVTATVDDTGTGNSAIVSAELTFDGGLAIAMTADDGSFNNPVEDVTGMFTAPDEPGLYEACVTGTDAGGNTSAAECITVAVYDPSGGFVTGGGWINSPEGAMRFSTTPWMQDFSVDDEGWRDADDAWHGGIVVSGGVATFTGNEASAPFSGFDAYRDAWPGTWMAEIDVYLDPSWPTAQGFDYSVAATGADGAHQRDFIFHVGTVENYGSISGKALLVNGSNNTDFSTNPFKLVNENGGNYYEVTSAGWYTLQHVFRDEGGHLAVDLNLLDAGGTILWTVTRENVADAIPDEVGGNRYAWFTHIDVDGGIQVDNHELHLDGPSPEGKATFGFVAKYKKGANAPDGNTQFTFKTGDLDFHSTSYDWLVVNQNDSNAQFKGEGTVNGEPGYSFMLWAGDHDDGDTFRIRITGPGGVVYDNGSDQVIGGGSILVHSGKGKK